MDSDYADDLALLTNTHSQSKSLLHSSLLHWLLQELRENNSFVPSPH